MSPKENRKNITLLSLIIKMMMIVIIVGIMYILLTNIAFITPILTRREAKNASGLKIKNDRMIELENQRDFAQIYDELLAPEGKKKPKEQYITGVQKEYEKYGAKYSTFKIHNVYIEGDTGFIDRTRIDCFDNNCNDTKESRTYRKWKYINGKWLSTLESAICSRSDPYETKPEFERSLSLLRQRYENSFDTDKKTYIDMVNCIAIDYADLKNEGAEGVFYFDDSISSPEKLVIQVDNSYQSYDDLSTAFLLSHELVHAKQFIELLFLDKQRSCVDKEVEAFLQQINFSFYLNPEESKSLVSRAEKISNENKQLQIYADLMNMSGGTIYECTNGRAFYTSGYNYSEKEFNCVQENLIRKLRNMVTQNPVYKDQCGL